MKHRRIIAGITITVIFLASFVGSFLHPKPLEVARAYCTKKGIRAEDLALIGYRSGGLFGNNVTVEFQVNGSTPPKTLVIKLRQPLYVLSPQVVDFHEEFPHE